MPGIDEPVDWRALLALPTVDRLLTLALEEDLGPGASPVGDLTTRSVFAEPKVARAAIVARRATVACGLPLAAELLARVDRTLSVRPAVAEGAAVAAGAVLLEVEGDVRTILTAERCVLNFLMRLCGIAAATRAAVVALPPGSRTQVLDTRKTTPGWRALDKAAVRVGGGVNHRSGLYDGVLIKDNHIAAAGSLGEAVRRARDGAAAAAGRAVEIEVEIDGLDQLEEALAAGADIVLLDNFGVADVRAAVLQTRGRAKLEASGGITAARLPEVAATGVDRVSLGALTHTVVPADLSLELPAPVRWLVERHEQVGSTMAMVRERAAAGAPEGTVVVARSLSAARGRRGRVWHAPAGGGLWVTLLLLPTRSDFHTLGLVAGAAVLEAARELAGAADDEIGLKWPNDVVARGRKLAGVLLEAESAGDAKVVSVGIGLNLKRAAELGLPPDIESTAIGMTELAGREVEVEEALAAVLGAMSRRYNEWTVRGLAPVLRVWSSADALRGRTVRAEGGAAPVEGIADGIDADGSLRIVRAGEVARVTAGEVTLAK